MRGKGIALQYKCTSLFQLRYLRGQQKSRPWGKNQKIADTEARLKIIGKAKVSQVSLAKSYG